MEKVRPLPSPSVKNVLNPGSAPIEFSQLDKITEIVAGEQIRAVKSLHGDEDYLRDHFPKYPVMPGVLMLEAMFQSASWLIHFTNDFAHSVVELREAKNIKFQDFVTPGKQLDVFAQIQKQNGLQYSLKAECRISDSLAVSGRLVIETYNRSERYPSNYCNDSLVAYEKRCQFGLLHQNAG